MVFLQKFRYRAPRFVTAFPIELIFKDVGIDGSCYDISADGIRAELTRAVDVGDRGVLVLKPGRSIFALEACVTHTEDLEAGIRFLFETPEEQAAIRKLLLAVREMLQGPRRGSGSFATKDH